ncbi:Rz1-like lysis system protein LysC [Dickeya chrysanthemi]|uniref:Rz1-like lysis system protein LysC n=1 Tax=Dickeya TaxID=204037 RepID=UPI001E47E41A|nr:MULTISPECIES: Rz1-like lysis system protein LysC [Dickeya]WJM87476.1 Rz1-like lysis system protein LysC [Dickeya chrysanthemi]
MTLSGCVSAPPSPVAVLTVNGCPRLTPCRFPTANPQTNGELNALLDETEAALAMCADQVDMVIDCQAKSSATDSTVDVPPGQLARPSKEE